MKILVLGGASYDEIIHVNEFFEAKAETIFANNSYSTVGSTGVGKALALKKLGFDVAFQAIIGKDIYGKMMRFMVIQVIGLILTIAFPQIVLWLPEYIYGK